MCHALAEVVSLISEVRREAEARRRTSSERMEDLVDIRTEVQRRSTEGLYTMTFGSGVGCKYGEACGKVRSACG